MFGRRRRAEARRAAARAAEMAEREREARLRAGLLEAVLDLLHNYEEAYDESGGDLPIVTKRGEQVVSVGDGYSLVEARSRRVRHKGRSHGVSIRIAKGVWYRPTVHTAESVVQSEELVLLDEGEMVITDRRVVFAGNRQTREFRFSKLMAMRPSFDPFTFTVPVDRLLLPVENRVRTSGLAWPRARNERRLEIVTALTNFGVALGRGDSAEYLARLEQDLRAARREIARLSAARDPT